MLLRTKMVHRSKPSWRQVQKGVYVVQSTQHRQPKSPRNASDGGGRNQSNLQTRDHGAMQKDK